MRIFCVSGSRNKKSVGAALAHQLENKFNELGEETIFYIGQKFNLSPCEGCSMCFDQGICPLDDIDGFGSVKEQILKSDLIITLTSKNE